VEEQRRAILFERRSGDETVDKGKVSAVWISVLKDLFGATFVLKGRADKALQATRTVDVEAAP
jgi:hypothetical protein